MQITPRRLALLAIALAIAGCSGGSDEETDPGSSSILYVAPTAVGLADGSSWANASTLVYALANAPIGGQIWIQEGLYKPTTTTTKTISFTISKRLSLYGGFIGTEAAVGDRDLAANRTVLSGDIGTVGTASDNSHVVVSITAANVLLDGLEVASANGTAAVRGAGIDASVSATGLTLRNVVVRENTNARTASYGAGLVLAGTAGVAIRDCVFAVNAVSAGSGGGLWLGPDGSATLVNCLFVGNTASASGAAILSSDGQLSLMNLTVYNNDNAAGTGPVHAIGTSLRNVTVSNCMFDANSSGVADGSVTFAGSVLLTQSYNRLEKASAPVGTNTTGAVTFVNAADPDGSIDDLYGTTDDGLRLDATSSTGIGAGGTGASVPSTDLSGEPRGPAIDMGAYDQLPPG